MFYVERGLQFRTNTALSISLSLCQKCPHLEFFWSVFFLIRTEYGEIRSISYSVSTVSVFSPNAGKYGAKKLRMRTLFTLRMSLRVSSKEQERNIPR